MGSFSIAHWIVVAVIVILLFGRGRISDVMGDVARGIRSFKKGLNEDDAPKVTAHTPAAQPDEQKQKTN